MIRPSGILFLITLLFCTISSNAQDDEPPALSMPVQNNQILIDELASVSGMQDFFISYCTSRIETEGKRKNLTQTRIAAQLKKISFGDFKKLWIYNSYSTLSSDQLTQLIAFFKSAGKEKNNQRFFLADRALLTNLADFCERYLDE